MDEKNRQTLEFSLNNQPLESFPEIMELVIYYFPVGEDCVPLFIQNGRAVSRRAPSELNPYLGQLSLATLLFVLTFGLGQLAAG